MGIIAESLNRLLGREEYPSPDDAPAVFDHPSPSPNILPPSRRHSSVIDRALSLGMVYRAVQINTTSAKQISFDSYRANAEGKEVAIPRQDMIGRNGWFLQPDPEMPRAHWIEQTVSNLSTHGNAFWEVKRKNDSPEGEIIAVKILNPNKCFPVARQDDSEAVAYYRYGNRELKPWQVKHLKLLRVGGLMGLGPIQAARIEIAGAADVAEYSAKWFNDAGVPEGILSSEQSLNQDDAKRYKEAFKEAMTNGRDTVVLGKGLEYRPIMLNPKDAQWLESQNFNITQIARLFGVPASLMLATVEGNTQTYQNVAQDWLGYVRFTLINYLIEIETALTSLLPHGQRARFNNEALLRADTETRFRIYKMGIEAGIYTPEEVREIEKI